MRSRAIRTSLFTGVVAFGSLAPPASADILGNAFEITVTSSAGTDFWRARLSDGVFSDDGFTWTLTQDIELRTQDTDEWIATLESEGTWVSIQNDPVLSLNFNVTAGPLGGAFTISAPQLLFSPLLNPDARASAGITVTDLAGDGLSLAGAFAGGTESYKSVTNGIVGGGGTLFRDLINNTASGVPFNTVDSDEAFPLAGFTTIPGSVSSMHSEFQFTLGPSDTAAGTSVFVVVPEPVTATMLLIGSAGILIRRRRA